MRYFQKINWLFPCYRIGIVDFSIFAYLGSLLAFGQSCPVIYQSRSFCVLFSLDAFADSGILKLDAYSDTDTDVMHPQ